ncbi:cell division protein ZipA [Vreelandella rituensis]|uniref:Cell division protein ZipA n=1 Tax=Vreelandella rituensis TaxID=2282306 RepID=A0A368U2V2_9GAMM|nr:cell division protein ZipA [Halomonas rituensis]RCV91378.1 cell division protein ZipA [Halomonas rituensis]
MELREWLIILGLALVTLIVIDGVRRLQRQRRVPRLDQAEDNPTSSAASATDPEEAAREAEINWELPNGGARVIRSADYSAGEEKPKLKRQDHPGPSKVLSEFRRSFSSAKKTESEKKAESTDKVSANKAARGHAERGHKVHRENGPSDVPSTEPRREPHISASHISALGQDEQPAQPAHPDNQAAQDIWKAEPEFDQADMQKNESAGRQSEPLASSPSSSRRQLRGDTAGNDREASAMHVQPEEDQEYEEEDRYRLVDFEGLGRSFKERLAQRREAKQERKAEKARRAAVLAEQKAERKALEAEQQREADAAAQAQRLRMEQEKAQQAQEQAQEQAFQRDMAAALQEEQKQAGYADDYPADDLEYVHPAMEKALRNDVGGALAKETLTNAEEVVVISIISRDEEGFSGGRLLDLMLACGLRYSSEMGIFHRFETESPDSELQFSMVNMVKPGTFPIEAMSDFTTPGITLLMPLPGADNSSAAFEAMVETAMVVVRHMGGELKDENHSVMTAQTIEFARQRVHEFERRHRLNRQLQAH